jgi:hypothetical protein
VALLALFLLPLVVFLPIEVFAQPSIAWFLLGLSCALAISIPAMTVVIVSGISGPMMGAVAEGWTADELRRLHKRGYESIGAFRIRDYCDVDHVLLTPSSIWVFETKWTSATWTRRDLYHAGLIDAAIAQVTRNAKDVSLDLDVAKSGVHVQPVLVLWGESSPDALDHEDSAVLIVPGGDLRSWLLHLPEGEKTIDVAASYERLAKSVRSRDEFDSKRDLGPAATSMHWLWRNVFGPILSFLGGTYLLLISVSDRFQSAERFIAASAVAIAAALVFLRPKWRWLALSFVVGTAAGLILLGSWWLALR